MWNPAPPGSPLEASINLQSEHQLHPRDLLPKTFFVSSQVKYVAAHQLSRFNHQLSTGFDLAFRFSGALRMGSASEQTAISNNPGRAGAENNPLTTRRFKGRRMSNACSRMSELGSPDIDHRTRRASVRAREAIELSLSSPE